MKKLILILFLLIGYLAESQVSRIYTVDKTIVDSKAYRKRVTTDAGAIRTDNIEKAFRAMAIQNEMYDNIQFAWFGESGYKHRVASATASFWSKLYSSKGTNDATQTTELNQPYLSGNIAPNERYAMKNTNGSSKFITHPTISFAANEAWSVTTVLNQASINLREYYAFGGDTYISVQYISLNGEGYGFYQIQPIAGKNVVITLTCNGSSLISMYVNGVFHVSYTFTNTSITLNQLFFTSADYSLSGKIYAHIIRSGALTQSQVTNEYNFFRSIYPEVETVKIGTQDWATSNLDMVVNSAGTVIPDGNVQATWIGGTAFWCYHTDNATGAIYGKLYNKAARNVIITSPPDGYHVSTEAELMALALYGGYKLKKEGTNYWTTANGTNSTGFTAIGGSSRNADGTFNTIKNTASFWCADSDKVLLLNHADNSATITAATANQGHSIRLIKN